MNTLKTNLIYTLSLLFTLMFPLTGLAHEGHGLEGSPLHAWLHGGEWLPLLLLIGLCVVLISKAGRK